MQATSRYQALTAALTLALLPTAHAESQTLDPVLVTATRTPMRANELLADTTVITREEIQQKGQVTLAEVLSSVPGIFITEGQLPGKQSSFFIRGTNSGHALLLVDGIPLTSATLGEAPFDMIPAQEIERVEVLRGPASALYGSEAIGGVIQVFTTRGQGPLTPRFSAKVGSHNTRETSGGISGGNQLISYALSASTFDSDGISATRGPLSNPDKDGYSSRAASASLQVRPAVGHEVGMSYLQTDNTNHMDGNVNFDDRTKTSLSSWNIYSRNRILKDWTSTLRMGESRNAAVTYEPATMRRYETTQTTLSWQNEITTRLGGWLVAVEEQKHSIDSNQTYTLKSRDTHSYLLGWNQVFGNHRLQANTRRDHISGIGAKDTWSAAYGYQFTEQLRAFISQGTAFKAPSFNDLYFPSTCYPIWGCFGGNPNLKPESSKNTEIGMAWENTGHEARVVYYDNRATDLIDWGNTPDNIGKAKITGSTWSYRGTWHDLSVSTALDLTRPTDEITGKVLRRRAEEQFTLALSYKLGNLTFGGDMKSVGSRYEDKENQSRMGGFSLFNAFVRHPLDKDWSIEGQIKNIGDRQYELYRGSGDTQFMTAGRTLFVGLRYTPK